MNLYELLNFAAERFPNKDALIWNNGKMSYQDLKENSNRFANYLLNNNLQKGEKVALIFYNTPEMIVALFGILKAGGVVVPISYKSQSPEIQYLVEHSDSTFVIYDQTLSDVVVKGTSNNKQIKSFISLGTASKKIMFRILILLKNLLKKNL
ncbi:MAG: AMP-binding protein [Stygiobacter sp.]